jgi:hypothetical protein
VIFAAILTRASPRSQRQLQVVQPVGFGFIQPLQLVADLIRAANYFTML